jgi:hypothetical protein
MKSTMSVPIRFLPSKRGPFLHARARWLALPGRIAAFSGYRWVPSPRCVPAYLTVGSRDTCQGRVERPADPPSAPRYGFECGSNLGCGDRRRNLNPRGGPQKRLDSLQIRQDALPLVSILTEGVG